MAGKTRLSGIAWMGNADKIKNVDKSFKISKKLKLHFEKGICNATKYNTIINKKRTFFENKFIGSLGKP